MMRIKELLSKHALTPKALHPTAQGRRRGAPWDNEPAHIPTNPNGVQQTAFNVESAGKTPLGFGLFLCNATQGGAASPLTLGFGIQPLRGIRCTTIRRCMPFLILACAATSGCGGKSAIDRAVVQGAVSYQGAPVEKGEIAFIPTGQQPSTIARILDGTYRIEAKGGVPVGGHKVQIKAFRPANTTAATDLAVGGRGKQYLPSKFNTQSELIVNVESNGNAVTHDFHLK